MTTAVVGIVGTILGVVVGSLLNFFLSALQEKRRWKREDQSKFVLERLALYRDFLHEMERAFGGKVRARDAVATDVRDGGVQFSWGPQPCRGGLCV